jgi:hypothetical protein
MTPVLTDPRAVIATVQRALRRDALLSVVLVALSVVPGALVAAWIAGLLRPWSRPGAGPLLLDALALAAVALLLWGGARRWVRTIDEGAVAADAERNAGVPEGTVRGVLELCRNLPAGTSPALARRAETAVARHFTGGAAAQLAGMLGTRIRRRRGVAASTLATLTLAVALLGFVAPEHSRAAWSPLVQPIGNLTPPPLPPLRVLPGDVTVPRGTDLAVHVEAAGRTVVTLRWRQQGDVAREQLMPIRGDTALATIPLITEPTDYWVEAPDGHASMRHRITPIDPLLLAELSVDVLYPAHVGRAAERFRGDVPLLEVPEGTQLVVRGRSTRPLRSAQLNSAVTPAIALKIEGDVFHATFSPTASGIYAWTLHDHGGSAAAVPPPPLEIIVVRDLAPHVEITFPASDTILDSGLRQGIIAEARDDHGLVAATLVSRRITRAGARGADVEDRIPLNGTDRALIRTVLDARSRELVPGDRLEIFVRVTDNSPRAQAGSSRVLTLRLPTMEELRELSAQEASAMLSEATDLARSTAQLRDATRTLERRTSAANARGRAQQSRQPGLRGEAPRLRLDFGEAAQAQQALDRQEQLLERLELMRRNIDQLERSLEQAGLRDSQLQERLAELRRQYEEMLTPQARRQLEQLRDAIREMDAEAVQQALAAMAAQQERMKQQLDESVEMLSRAAAEQEMNSLAQDARELATQQQALSQALKDGEPTREQAAAQQQLAERAEQLAQDLAGVQQRLEEHGEAEALSQAQAAERQVREAVRQMEQAARDAARQDGERAAERGVEAAAQLERTAESLEQARDAMAEGRRQEAQESMQQATTDALALAQRQQELLDQMRQAEAAQRAGEQEQREGQAQGARAQRPDQQAVQPPAPPRGPPQPGRQSQPPQSGESQQNQPGQQGQQSGQQQGGQQPRGEQGGRQGQGEGQGEGEARRPQQGQSGGSGAPDMQSMRSEQVALQEGLQQLSRNLQETAERSGSVNREVGAALARANLSMQQTLESLQQEELPVQQAQQTVEALNRLALSLLNNAQQMNAADGGAGTEPGAQMADIAQRQGSVNGQLQSLPPMNLSAGAMSQQLNRLAAEQLAIARRLGGMNTGGRDDSFGEIDILAREAEEVARQVRTGGPSPEVLARQQRLFHRLLDAGRSLEKDEYEDERAGEQPGRLAPHTADPLDSRLFDDATRFRAPTAEELRALPPAYRRLILDYFERLNRPLPPESQQGGGRH